MPVITTPRQRSELLKICDPVDGPIYWMTHYYKTFDKPKGRIASWPGWPYLHKYVMQLHNPDLRPGDQQNLLVEKSRDMMITITTAGYMLYCVQYVPDWSGFVTSRKQAEVDDGGDNSTPDSIFGMMRFSWLEQLYWTRAPLGFTQLKIRNLEPGMNSYVTGESANPSAGRGKSVTFKYGDEFAFVPQSHKVHASMSGGNYRTLLYSSTANFTGNAFYDIRNKEDSGFDILTYHYSLRPGRDGEWAEKMKKKYSDLVWATEYEIQYEFTTERSVYPKYNPQVHVVSSDKLPFDGTPSISFDDGSATPGAMYFCLKRGETLWIVDEIYEAGIQVRLLDSQRENGGKDWVMLAKGMCLKHGYDPKDVTIVLGPESSSRRGHSNTAMLFALEGFPTHVVDDSKLQRIRIVDKLMIHSDTHKPRLFIGDTCPNLIWELPRYERKVVNGQVTETPKQGNDHGCDALADIAQFYFPDIMEETETGGDWGLDPESWETDGMIGE